MATRNSIVLLLILTMMITATVNTTTMRTMQSTRHQNSNSSTNVRELSPSTSTYWAKTYGGTDFDEAYCVRSTADEGYIVAGNTQSFDEGYIEAWVLKLNSTGGVTWQKIYGDSGGQAYSVQQTTDGGYIVAGESSDSRIWVLKLNSTGGVKWQKTYGLGDSEAYSVQQTSDGGYVVAGMNEHIYGDVWVAKLDSTGGVTWQKTYGGSGEECANSIQQTTDGGYIVAGYTKSFGAGNGDVWVLKLNSTGGVDWQKTYGGGDLDRAHSAQQTTDGGYIVAGGARGIAGDLSFTSGDVWVLKLNSTGGVTWQKTYGGSHTDWARSVQQTSDGGYIVAGDTYSFGTGADDFYVLKLDSTGGVTWQNAYGGSPKSDCAYSVQQTSDGGYIVAGYAYSFGAGYYDFWVVKLGAGGEIVWDGGSGASTHTSSVSPSYFGATVSTSSATPVSSSTQAGDTGVTPLDSTATVIVQASVGTVQSGGGGGGGGGGTGQGNNLIIIIGGVALVAVVVVISIVGIKMRKK